MSEVVESQVESCLRHNTEQLRQHLQGSLATAEDHLKVIGIPFSGTCTATRGESTY